MAFRFKGQQSNGPEPLICNGYVMLPPAPSIICDIPTIKIRLTGTKDNKIVEITREVEVSGLLDSLLAYYTKIDESQRPVLISDTMKTELAPGLKISSYNLPKDEVLTFKLVYSSDMELGIEPDSSSKQNSESNDICRYPSDNPWVTQRLLETKIEKLHFNNLDIVSQLDHGKVYFATFLFDDRKEILTYKKLPPMVAINENPVQNVGEVISNNFNFIAGVINNWNQAIDSREMVPITLAADMQRRYKEYRMCEDMNAMNSTSVVERANMKFRQGFFAAALTLYSKLDIPSLGYLYHHPIFVNHDTAIIFTVQSCMRKEINTDLVKQSKLSFNRRKDLSLQYFNQLITDKYSNLFNDYELITRKNEYALKTGLYLGVFVTSTGAKDTKVLVQSQTPSLIPLCTIRSGVNEINYVEQQYLQSLIDSTDEAFLKKNPTQIRLKQELRAAFEHLSGLTKLDLSLNSLYSAVPFQLDNDASLLVINAPGAQLGESVIQSSRLFEFIDINLFETLHFSKYQSRNYTHLSRANYTLGPLIIQASAIEKLTNTDSTLSIEKDRAAKKFTYFKQQAKLIQESWISQRWTRMALNQHMDRTNASAFKSISARLKELSEHTPASSDISKLTLDSDGESSQEGLNSTNPNATNYSLKVDPSVAKDPEFRPRQVSNATSEKTKSTGNSPYTSVLHSVKKRTAA